MIASPDAPGPVFVDLPADLALHADPPMAEIWYVTCVLSGGGRRFGVQSIVTTSPSGRLFTSVSIVDLGATIGWHAIDRVDPAFGAISSNEFDIATPAVALSGSIDAMTYRVAAEGNGAELTLTRCAPLLFNCGTGMFPYFTGPTFQFDIPAMAATGTVTIDGVVHEVSGGAWWDRQWSASRDAFGTKRGFTWFGICLDNGCNLSVWDTTAPDGSGHAWATVVACDGAHSVVRMASTRHDGWTLELPSIDTTLEVTHELVHCEPRFYSGILTVEATVGGSRVGGYGVVDTVPH